MSLPAEQYSAKHLNAFAHKRRFTIVLCSPFFEPPKPGNAGTGLIRITNQNFPLLENTLLKRLLTEFRDRSWRVYAAYLRVSALALTSV
jgi:hypothetical protein